MTYLSLWFAVWSWIFTVWSISQTLVHSPWLIYYFVFKTTHGLFMREFYRKYLLQYFRVINYEITFLCTSSTQLMTEKIVSLSEHSALSSCWWETWIEEEITLHLNHSTDVWTYCYKTKRLLVVSWDSYPLFPEIVNGCIM